MQAARTYVRENLPTFEDMVGPRVYLLIKQAEQYYFSRWTALLGAVLAASVSGVTFAFSVFASAAVSELGYSESEMRYASSVGVSGKYIGAFCTGIAGGYLGPRVSILLGTLCMAIAYGSLAAFSSDGENQAKGDVAFVYLIGSFGTAFYVTTATTVVLKNFPPTRRGAVSGYVKAFIGLSFAFLQVLYDVIHAAERDRPTTDSVKSFCNTIMACVIVFGCFSALVLNYVPGLSVPFHFETSHKLSIDLTLWHAHLAGLCLLLLVLDLCAAYGHSPGAELGASRVLLALLVLIFLPGHHGPLMREHVSGVDFDALLFGRETEMNTIGLKEKQRKSGVTFLGVDASQLAASKVAANAAKDPAKESAPPPPSPQADAQAAHAAQQRASASFFDEDLFGGGGIGMGVERAANASDEPVPGRTLHDRSAGAAHGPGDALTTFFDGLPEWVDKNACGVEGALRQYSFWVLFSLQVIGEGAAILLVRHMPLIIRAARRDESESSPAWLDIIVGLSDAIGGASIGALSDAALKRGVPRTTVIGYALFALAMACFLAATGVPGLLEVSFVAAGVCYGAIVTMGAALCADLFGLRHYGTNFAFLQLATAFGSLIFATAALRIGFKGDVDVAAEAEPTLYDDDANVSFCSGLNCFGPALALSGFACLGGVVLATRVLPNTRIGRTRIVAPAAAHKAAREAIGSSTSANAVFQAGAKAASAAAV